MKLIVNDERTAPESALVRYTSASPRTLTVVSSSAAPKKSAVLPTLVHPNKLAGRVVLGPRRVRSGYARIVANSNGSGSIELFDAAAGQCAPAWIGVAGARRRAAADAYERTDVAVGAIPDRGGVDGAGRLPRVR